MWDQFGDSTVSKTTHKRTPGITHFGIFVVVLAIAFLAISSMPNMPVSGNLGQVPDAVLRLPNLVFLEAKPEDIQTIIANSMQRGRRWEPPAHISFLSDGVLKFESNVGVRIHGDVSRTKFTHQKSFRVYFRKALEGINAPGPFIGFEKLRSHNVLVLHGDERHSDESPEGHYMNPIAYDIARRIGVMTAETVPIALVINDGTPQPYVLTEYIDIDYVESRFGHRDFDIYDSKDLAPWVDSAGPVFELRSRFGDPRNWTLEEIGKVVDLDNLSRWYLTALFCGTRDLWQGKLVRDRSKSDAKWFWIAQDLDGSFLEYDGATPFPQPVWEFDRPLRFRDFEDPRVILLRQLFTNEQFRRSFARLFVDIRDNLLTPEFLDEVLSRYERAAAVYGVEDIAYQGKTRTYLARRPTLLGDQIVKYLHVDIR
jgi:hypothetical protein